MQKWNNRFCKDRSNAIHKFSYAFLYARRFKRTPIPSTPSGVRDREWGCCYPQLSIQRLAGKQAFRSVNNRENLLSIPIFQCVYKYVSKKARETGNPTWLAFPHPIIQVKLICSKYELYSKFQCKKNVTNFAKVNGKNLPDHQIKIHKVSCPQTDFRTLLLAEFARYFLK